MAEPAGPELLERGDIFFFYRPKVEQEEAHGIDEVQRFQVVMRTAGGRLFRMLTIGRKHLPDLQAHEREWGFVDLVSEDVAPVAEALRATTYETKTRGVRHLAAARPAGEGAYALQRDGRNLVLAYRLELPTEPGPVQEELGVVQEAAYVIALKNPDVPNPPNIGLREEDRVHFPAKEQRQFHGTGWSAADKHLLDFERAEFVMIGATDHPSALPAERQEPSPEAVLRRLKLSPRDTPLEPLVRGEWA